MHTFNNLENGWLHSKCPCEGSSNMYFSEKNKIKNSHSLSTGGVYLLSILAITFRARVRTATRLSTLPFPTTCSALYIQTLGPSSVSITFERAPGFDYYRTYDKPFIFYVQFIFQFIFRSLTQTNKFQRFLFSQVGNKKNTHFFKRSLL